MPFTIKNRTGLLAFIGFTALGAFLSACRAPLVMQEYRFHTILWDVDWSSNGDVLATGGNHDRLTFLGTDSLSILNTMPLPKTITNLEFHPSNSTIAVSYQLTEKPAFIYDTITHRKINLRAKNKNGSRGMAWSPNGQFLAVGDNDGLLTIYNIDGKLLSTHEVDPKAITGLDWHPTKNQLVTIGSQISIVYLDAFELVTVTPRDNEVLMLCVDWHPSGEFFVTGDYGDFEIDLPPLIQFWSADGELQKEIVRSKAEIRSLKWSPDGNTFATTSDQLRLWNSKGKLLDEIPLGSHLWGLDWHPDGQRIACTSGLGKTYILDSKLNILSEFPPEL